MTPYDNTEIRARREPCPTESRVIVRLFGSYGVRFCEELHVRGYELVNDEEATVFESKYVAWVRAQEHGLFLPEVTFAPVPVHHRGAEDTEILTNNRKE